MSLHHLPKEQRSSEGVKFGRAAAPLLKQLAAAYVPSKNDGPLWLWAAVGSHDVELLRAISNKNLPLGSYLDHEALAQAPGALELHLKAGVRLTDKLHGVPICMHLKGASLIESPNELSLMAKALRQEDPSIARDWEGEQVHSLLIRSESYDEITPSQKTLSIIQKLDPSRPDWLNLTRAGTPVWAQYLAASRGIFEKRLSFLLDQDPPVVGDPDAVWAPLTSLFRSKEGMQAFVGASRLNELLQRFYPQKGMLSPAHLPGSYYSWMSEGGVVTELYKHVKDPLFWLGQPRYQMRHGQALLSAMARGGLNQDAMTRVAWVCKNIGDFSAVHPSLKAALALAHFCAGKSAPDKIKAGAKLNGLNQNHLKEVAKRYPKARAALQLMMMEGAVHASSATTPARRRM